MISDDDDDFPYDRNWGTNVFIMDLFTGKSDLMIGTASICQTY